MAFEYWQIMNEYGNGIEFLRQTEQLHIQTDPIKYISPWANSVSIMQPIPCLQYESKISITSTIAHHQTLSSVMCPSHTALPISL